jgi:hypothetical protein
VISLYRCFVCGVVEVHYTIIQDIRKLALLKLNVFYKRVVNISKLLALPTLINYLKSFYYALTLCPLSTIK